MNTTTAAARLATSLRRITRSSNQPQRPPAPAPTPPDEPNNPHEPLARWQYTVDKRLAALERRHDASTRRQTLLILTTIIAEIGLEILKRR